jgi:lipopolysaccharide biosynthesis glycosyltransferase
MDVLCACDEGYFPHAATMLCSVLEHNMGARIHLFHDSISGSELDKLESFVARRGSTIVFYEVNQAAFAGLRVDKWASIAVYFRLLAPRLLPSTLDKVLYLDCDIIVRRSLQGLWDTDISGYALAGVSNYDDGARKALGLPDGTKYFNSGVLLINLAYWRERRVAEAATLFARENSEKMQFWDQDALNGTLVNRWIEVPPTWNWQFPGTLPENGNEFEPAVVHFTTKDKPWHWLNAHILKSEYYRYRGKTPWRQYVPHEINPNIRNAVRSLVPRHLRSWLRARVS